MGGIIITIVKPKFEEKPTEKNRSVGQHHCMTSLSPNLQPYLWKNFFLKMGY